jgi:ribosomal protein S18 acetylase RimI-like enzyme
VEAEIRVAGLPDLWSLRETLGNEHSDYYIGRYPLQEKDLGAILVACTPRGPVGAVFVSWDVPDEPEVRRHLAGVPAIFRLHVAPGHRHRGIGRSLLRHAENVLRRRGHTRVLLGVNRSNHIARELYLWLGYRRPEEPELSGLGGGETYDILVADLDREPPDWG